MKSKVYLVGAGIGDFELLTLKAKRILDESEVIVYDRLLAKEIVDRYSHKELYYVGKQSGNHVLTQSEINDLIVELVENGRSVVRLKGGDPYVFGRGAEEAIWLLKNGIDFEVVPGLTSGVVAPMYAGIPVTHRDFSTSVSFITGHRRDGIEQDYSKYSQIDGTLVFFMGLSNIVKIVTDLIAGGKDVNTPVAVIVNGASPRQEVVTGTLRDIIESVASLKEISPAMIVVGEVVRLRDKLNFYEKLPLFGATITITRSRAQSSEITERLRRLGACVYERPMYEINKINQSALDNAIKNIGEFGFVLFTSVNAVDIFMRKVYEFSDIRVLGGIKFITIGSKTAESLTKYGIISDFIPVTYDSDALMSEMSAFVKKDDGLFWPHSNLSTSELIGKLSSICKLTHISVYENSICVYPGDFLKADYTLFSSSSTVHNCVKIYGTDSLKSGKVIAIGNKTAAAMAEYGCVPYAIPEKATFDSMIDFILEDFKNENA